MSLPYPYTTNNQYHINTGSYLDQKETEMLVTGYANDLWYGFGETDVIEMSVFDLDQNPLGWQTINSEKEYKLVTMTYLDALDRPTEYTYKQLISDFTLYRNTKILVNPLEQLTKDFGITSGSYLLTYNFIREMAGTPSASLVVKDISPSRTEIKLIPAGSNNLRYQAFCLKKFQIKDVAPLLLQQTAQCPYDQIYTRVKDKYAKDIAFLKQLLFLNSDGAFVSFLKTLYEDVVVYTNPASLTQPVDRVKRTQGIKTYYQNLLLANYEAISDFIAIDDAYDAYAKTRVEQQFKPYGKQQNVDFVSAKQFLVEFFTTEFYHPITLSSKAAFEAKYFAYFKNAMNLGNNTMFTIIDHSYLDERLVETDPLTLLVKLKTELPDDVKIQTSCWISNISIAPFVVNAIVRTPMGGQTIKISPANFTLQSENVSLYNVNEQFTAASLRDTVADQQTIDINKTISELQVDYTDFSNFVVFSSAGQRVSNFKTKISSWYSLSQSLVILEENSSQSLAAGSLYPQYALERGSLDGQMQEIVTSFDGYESYLFKSGSYAYNPVSNTFVSNSYVVDQDTTASLYDKSNRDSLINNTPDHIVLDDGNDAYLTFLNMVGHYFDNIYLYITNLPSEKTVNNDPTLTFSKTMIDYMLDSFGWKVGTSDEDLSVMDTYTTASSMMSGEDRSKAVRTRLLNTLPQIYKTKGTEEAIKLLLSCHGIPSDLLQIREYGVNDYSTGSLVTYTKRERSCLFQFSGSGAAIYQTYFPRPTTRTVEFKILLTNPEQYPLRQPHPLVLSNATYGVQWDPGWRYHNVYPASAATALALGYYSKVDYPQWTIGFLRETETLGRIYACLPTITSSLYMSGSTLVVNSGSKITLDNPTFRLTSSLFPIFDGDIFSVRLRRNEPDPAYQYVTNQELVPSAYDLTVQRNEGGRRIFRSLDSKLGQYEDNMIWDGLSTNDVWETTGSLGNTVTSSIQWGELSGTRVFGAMGNMMVWDVSISDADFEIHCNDFSSFAYSGSNGEQHLIARMDADEAKNFLTEAYVYTLDDAYYFGYAYGNLPNKSEYYPTFHEQYITTSVVASGSWTGGKTGSLYVIEKFTGSLSGSISGSISGSGTGTFSQYSKFIGSITGTLSGSFNGIATGDIVSTPWTASGPFGGGKWTGSLYGADVISRSLFTGSFVGNGTGSFFGLAYGYITSSQYGTFYGTQSGNWDGTLTGSLSGSARAHYLIGIFNGYASGSEVTVQTIGTYTGVTDQIWYGTLSGSLIGNFTGSTGVSIWSGSSPWVHSIYASSYGEYVYGQIAFSGSMKGSTSSSLYFSTANNTTTYAIGSFSGSFLQPWTGSPHILYDKPVMPYSFTWYAIDNYYPLHPVMVQQQIYCNATYSLIVPEYPYEYAIRNLEKVYTTPNYGPNRFWNEKVKSKTQTLAARLDDKERSTQNLVSGVQTDSNLLGLYLDPQDAKNRDIVKFYGNNDVVDLIADPANMFSASYGDLKDLNEQYNSFGNRRVLYNELITLYKMYFNREVFDSVKNVIPARASVRTGILVEPTVLERPKYQHHPVFSESNTGSVFYYDVTASHYIKDPITKLMRFSGSVGNTSNGKLGLLFAEFNTAGVSSQSLDYNTMPANLTAILDISSIHEANFDYPVNFNRGYYCDLSDNLQFGNYGSLGGELGYAEAIGVTVQENLNTHTNTNNEEITFLVKKWDKYTIYFKSGSYVRTSNRNEDVYVSHSVWLYSLVGMTPRGYNTFFYTSSKQERSGSATVLTEQTDVSYILGVTHYFHRANTAKGTANQNINTIRGTENHVSNPYVTLEAPFTSIAKDTYFESFGGYPRNHYTHKRMQFSPVKFLSYSGKYRLQTSEIYVRGRQTVNTTIDDKSGLGDASLPVQSLQTSNVNLQQSDNVINQ